MIAWRSYGRAGEADVLRAVIHEPGRGFGEIVELASGPPNTLGGRPRAAALPDGTLEVAFAEEDRLRLATAPPGQAFAVADVATFGEHVRELAYTAAPDGRAVLAFGDGGRLFSSVRAHAGEPFGRALPLGIAGTDVEAVVDPAGAVVAALDDDSGLRQPWAVALTHPRRLSRRERYRGASRRRVERGVSELELALGPDGRALATWRSGCPSCAALVHAAAIDADGTPDPPAVLSRLGDAPSGLRTGSGVVLWSGTRGAARGAWIARSSPGPAAPRAGGPPRVEVALTRAVARRAVRTGRLPVRVRCDRACLPGGGRPPGRVAERRRLPGARRPAPLRERIRRRDAGDPRHAARARPCPARAAHRPGAGDGRGGRPHAAHAAGPVTRTPGYPAAIGTRQRMHRPV